MTDLPIRPGLTLPAALLEWTAVRASGPGGQHVNRTSTRVELRFDLANCAELDDGAKARVRRLAGRRLDADGKVLLTSQLTRSQDRNLDDARTRLAELVARALEPPVKRVATRPGKAAKRRRVEDKRRQGERKRERGSADEP
ncbi:MAG: aminoacyl-tRNA hydrolase [Myxococcales bacterium]|nr:aminoacyl-tRNA hydrolase [Myxococcales bacterium]